MTFLEKTTQYIFNQHNLSQLKNICVILPSRRAAFYFKRDLAKLSDTPFLSPKVVAIDDFVMEMSGVKPIDSVALIFELFEVFKKFDSEVKFEKFISWATTLLKDFDTIDQYLVENPKAVFDFMSEAQAISRWNLELNQSNENLENVQLPNSVGKYFKLFENLNNVYHELRSRLITKGLAYRGMAYRLLYEEVKNLLLENSDLEKYYFLGFNALSLSEEKIIETLVKAKKAETIWDADSYLIDSKFNHRAGKLLRQYRSSGRYGEWKFISDNLLNSKKNLRIYGVENATLQTKIVGEIYRKVLEANPNCSTAIVLADENLLHPLIFSLSENVEDFNITMGLTLRNSSLFTLIEAIFELQQNIVSFKNKEGETIKIPKFSHRHISKILNHPLIRPLNDGFLLKHIIEKNIVFLSETEIFEIDKSHKIYQIIFKRWGDSPEKALDSFYLLIDELRIVYKESKDAIEIEYLYLFLTILNRLEKILFSNRDFSLKSFKHFLFELIKQERIPFSGEPVANLQIISLLETRCLDFEHVIFLSVNEGIIPFGKKQNSLIPFDACQEYNLPVHSDQDAILSYHFFRLLQRAKEIDLLYVLPTGDGIGGGGGEKSRFILQIENELAKHNAQINISYPKFIHSKSIDNQLVSKIEIEKNDFIIQALSTFLSTNGIYPTYLSEYLNCTLKFYFNRIAGISKREEIDEKFGADIFGTWLHDTLEKIDLDFGPIITKEAVQIIIHEIPDRLLKSYQEKFGGFMIESGMNFLLKQVGEQLLKDFFENQLETQNFPIEVLEVEKKIELNLEMVILGKVQKIILAGKIDRIERDGNTLKVIDYKTGIVRKKDLKPNSGQTLEEAVFDSEKDKLRQLWFYQYLVTKQMLEKNGLNLGGELLENYKVNAKIYSFRNFKENLEVNLSFNNDSNPISFLRKSEIILEEILSKLLNPEIPFSQTNDLEICQNCDFKGICGR